MRVFGFIEAEKANLLIKFMCERLGVTRDNPPNVARRTDPTPTTHTRRLTRERLSHPCPTKCPFGDF